MIDSFGDKPTTEHPAIAIQRKEHDERIKLEQEIRMSPKQITFVSPEPQEMPDIWKVKHYLILSVNITQCWKNNVLNLMMLTKKFSPNLKIRNWEIRILIQDELSNPFIYYEGRR